MPKNMRIKAIIATVFLLSVVVIMTKILSFFYPYYSDKLLWKDLRYASLIVGKSQEFSLERGKIINKSRESGAAFQKITSPFSRDKALRLALLSQIEREDPLFGGTGIDMDDYKKNLEELNQSSQRLKEILNLEYDLYPITFLNETGKVFEARSNLISAPSYEAGSKLLAAERQTVKAYRDYAKYLNKIVSRDGVPEALFVQAGGITSKKVITDDLSKIIRNSNTLDREITRRVLCLNFSSLFCNRDTLFSDKEAEIDKSTIEPPTLFKPNQDENRTAIVGGPYVIESRCGKERQDSNESRLIYSVIDDKSGLSPYPEDNIFFQRVTVEQYGEALYEQYMREGIEWEANFFDSSYACNDLTYLPALTTIDAFYRKYLLQPLVSESLLEKAPGKLKVLLLEARDAEIRLKNEKYPRLTTLVEIANTYAKSYDEIIRLQNQPNLPEIAGDFHFLQDELLLRTNFINGRMANYESLIKFLAFRTRGHAEMSKLNKKGQTEKEYTYVMRNSYSILLLGFSRGVWRLDTELEYLTSETKMRDDLKSFNELSKEIGIEAVNKILSINRGNVVKGLEAEVDSD
jgi:hypothetical protein